MMKKNKAHKEEKKQKEHKTNAESSLLYYIVRLTTWYGV
jgi:hypothetical protein